MRYRMRPNERSAVPQHHIALDTETVPEPIDGLPSSNRHRLMLGVAKYWRYERGVISREDECRFAAPAEFWEWVSGKLHRRMPLWLWAHSLGFDLTATRFWERLEDGEYRLQDDPGDAATAGGRGAGKRPWRGTLVTDDPPTIVVAKHRSGAELKCVDTLNWFLCPLKELGAELGCNKLGMPGDAAGEDDWWEYCERDCEIVKRTVDAIVHVVLDNDLGNLRHTAAAQAMALYRHRCMDCAIDVDRDLDVKRLERAAYIGARHAIYYQGCVVAPGLGGVQGLVGLPPDAPCLDQGPVYVLDCVACYPAVMQDNFYPTRYLSTESGTRPARVLEYLSSLAVVAEVVCRSGDEALPYRDGSDVRWATGQVRTVLCGPELERHIRQGRVIGCGRVQLYARDRPFGSFVRATWRMRREYSTAGMPMHARLAKLLANALHGKFGQRAHQWEMVPGERMSMPWGMEWRVNHGTGASTCYRSIGYNAQRREPSGESPDSFPAIAAYVTSYARELMRSFRLTAGPRNTLYEDADCIHVAAAGYDALHRSGMIGDGEPGLLRITQQADSAVYRAYKDYKVGDREVIGGLSGRAYCDPAGLWHQTGFSRLNVLLMACPHQGILSTETVMERPRPEIHGRVGADGWIEPPWVHM